MSTISQLPIPAHFLPTQVGEVWRVAYQELATTAKSWAQQYQIQPASADENRVCLLIIDAQNTFCIPGFELFVGGKSGTGAVDDNCRLCEFIYRNLAKITAIYPTLDTHQAMQIFHPIFWVNQDGEHPAPLTVISLDDVQNGVWQVNQLITASLAVGNYEYLQRYALHYVQKLEENGKYPLIIWPYHSMLGGIGHALVSAIEEVLFFHNIARQSQTVFEIKGDRPLTENYSVLSPEVLFDSEGQPIGKKNLQLIRQLLEFDRIIIAGQAKSHCVAWTIDDLLTEIQAQGASLAQKLAQKVYLLEDCTSSVVVPGVVDFSPQGDAAYQRFAAAGMNIVRSTDFRL